MAELTVSLGLWRHLAVARIRADWQYRTSFFLLLGAQVLATGADFLVILVIFSRVRSLGGWSASEVLFLYGVSGLSFGLADVFISPVEYASIHIKAGTFDRFLTRPLGALWQLCGTEFALRRIGRMFQPALVLAVAVGTSSVEWTPARVALVPMSIVCGAVIYGSIWVISSSISFWTVDSQEFASAFTYGGSTLTSYPVDVFGRWLQGLVIFVIPLASIAYLPGSELFDKPLPLGLPNWLAWTAPVIAVAAATIARMVWQFAIRHYRSTGS